MDQLGNSHGRHDHRLNDSEIGDAADRPEWISSEVLDSVFNMWRRISPDQLSSEMAVKLALGVSQLLEAADLLNVETERETTKEIHGMGESE